MGKFKNFYDEEGFRKIKKNKKSKKNKRTKVKNYLKNLPKDFDEDEIDEDLDVFENIE